MVFHLLPIIILYTTSSYHGIQTTKNVAAFVPPVTTTRQTSTFLPSFQKRISSTTTALFPSSSSQSSTVNRKNKYLDMSDLYPYEIGRANLKKDKLQHRYGRFWRFSRRTSLSATNNDETEGDANNNSSSSSKQSKPISTARVGGRRSSFSKLDKKKNDKLGVFQYFLPTLALLWLLQSLFTNLFFGSGSSNYVYYQSSTFESRTINSDGKIETARKESVRTNMPSLVKSGEDSSSSSSIILRDRRDEAFERELEKDIEREIDAAMRVMQRSILDDFF